MLKGRPPSQSAECRDHHWGGEGTKPSCVNIIGIDRDVATQVFSSANIWQDEEDFEHGGDEINGDTP